MNRLAVALIATLVVGCASPGKQDVIGRVPPISIRGWHELQNNLRDLPPQLRQVIVQEGEARLPRAEQAAMQNSVEQVISQAVLFDILHHAHDPALLPDAEFERLAAVVVGKIWQRQSYAAALAGYLTQSDFGCQQPVYAGYFQRRYPAANLAKPCNGDVPFAVFNQYDGAKIVWINPRRVKSIHLLFASKSQSMASRFGHIALRLVVCPEGITAAEVCNANLLEHVTLGFQAHIDELSLDTFKALNGDYKAYLFASRFMDVYEQYAVGEFREVYSLPLRMDDAQRELLVRELADIHWRYAGEYSFFTRNCATLMQDALKISWPDFAANEKMRSHYLRPDSLFEAIKSSSLAESDKLALLDEAEREGYFFSSTKQFYERALNEVREEMGKPAFADLEGYLQIDPVMRRQARTEDVQFSMRLATDQHLREAQLMLEEYSILRSGRVLMSEAAKYFEQQKFLEKADSIRAKLDDEHAEVFDKCLLKPIRQHTQPIQRLKGIPGKSDIPEILGQSSICQSVQSRKLLHETISGIKNANSEQWQKLIELSEYWAESIANLKLLKQM